MTASLDGTARIWDALVRADAAVFDRHAGNVASVSFSSDGRQPRSIRFLWESNECVGRPVIHEDRGRARGRMVRVVRVHRAGNFAAEPRHALGRVSRAAAGAHDNRLAGSSEGSASCGANGQHLAVDLGGPSGAVGIWDIAARRQIARLQRPGTKLELSAVRGLPGRAILRNGLHRRTRRPLEHADVDEHS